VHVLLIQCDPDLIKLTSSRFKALLPCREQLLVQVMPDDHSKSVPPLPIPNRTVKRLCADDSAATSVKVGYRQASYLGSARNPETNPMQKCMGFFFVLAKARSDATLDQC
jgi:hypothetical protein